MAVLLLSGTTAGATDKNDYVWIFGYRAGIDFRTEPPTALTSVMDALEGCASVTDRFGNLRFYTDGSKVWNRLHAVMPGGGNLTGMPYTISPTHSTSQGAVIVPVPDDPHRYYVFSLSDNAVTPAGNKGKLFYSIVDMTLDGGNGALVAGQTGVRLDSNLSEQMTSIPAAKCDIWLLVITLDHKLRSYRISAGGIQRVADSDLLPPSTVESENFIGKMEISPDGTRLAFARKTDISLYDFDRSAGTAGNGGYISTLHDPVRPASSYSVCFSPDNSKLYANQHDLEPGLFQFDMSGATHADIAASRVQVGNPVGGGMKRGPDGRIYYSPYYGQALHVINYPNLPAPLCDYREQVIPLQPGTRAALGFPNLVYTPLLDTQFSFRTLTAPCFAGKWTISPVTDSGWHYLWNNGDTSVRTSISGPGTYVVQYRTPCLAHVDTVRVDFRWLLPEIRFSAPCRMQDSTGRVWLERRNSEPYDAIWLDGQGRTLLAGSDTLPDIPAGNYYVRVTNDHGCDTVIPFRLDPEGFYASFISDTVVCMGRPLAFLNRSDAHFSGYRWDFGTGDTAAVAHVSYTFVHPGRYLVMLAASGPRCSDTAYRYVTVDSQYLAVPFTADRKEICRGEAIFFYPDSTGGEVLSLMWRFGSEMLAAVPGRPVRHVFHAAGLHVVSLMANFRVCDPVSYSDTIRVHDVPQLAIVPDSLIHCASDAVLELRVVTAVGGSYKYLWSTGSSDSGITVSEPGRYLVKVTGAFGCADSLAVQVETACGIRIPNVFTPDGDGVNDRFFNLDALSNGVVWYQVKIFNRWGQLIHTADRQNDRGWDGTWKGVPQPVGVYVYTAEFRFIDGHSERYQGNVTLLR